MSSSSNEEKSKLGVAELITLPPRPDAGSEHIFASSNGWCQEFCTNLGAIEDAPRTDDDTWSRVCTRVGAGRTASL